MFGVWARALSARGMGRTIALAAVAAGCASGPTLRDGVYRDPAQQWTIAAPPPGWTRVEVEDTALAFRGPGDASMAVTSRCEGAVGSAAVMAQRLRAGLGPSQLVETRGLDLAGRPAERQLLALPTTRIASVTRAAPPCVQDFVLVAPRDFDAALPVFDAWWASFAPESSR